ncbi:ComEC/Rec2 family competence protein [Zunongwangia sp.]|uniref:ComEC/Rec2 family competence protein n=1 Tax=Zunongwangia sp. TaxID=1965325 RepID=UPI003AA8A043
MGFINSKILIISTLIVSGILLAKYVSIPIQYSLLILIFSIICFLYGWYNSNRKLYPTYLFGFATYFIFLIFGFILYSIHSPKNQPFYYANNKSKAKLIKIVIQERLRSTAYQQRFLVHVNETISKEKEQLKHTTTTGKLLVYMPLNRLYEVGNQYYIPAKYKSISAPINPYQFNYRNYLENQGVLYQTQLSEKEILPTTWQSKKRLIPLLKRKVGQILNKLNLKKPESGILQALIIGDRTEINQKLYQNYASAGAIHILAVSGLHVGILLLFIRFILKPLRYLKFGKVIILLASLIGIWCFALVTGLSASVVRAATMFSFVALGLHLNRKTSLLNSIFCSFLILIIFNPYYIFQVGFQLSYAAILSIALWMPKFKKIWYPKNKIVNYYYQLIAVSICAQLGVFPLSIYYFHQFPGLFLLTNFIVLQLLPIVLIVGFMVLCLGYFNWFPKPIIYAYRNLLEFLNEVIQWIANQEAYIIRNIHLSSISCILLSLVILCLFFLLKSKKAKSLIVFLAIILLFQINLLYEKAGYYNKKLFILNKARQTVILQKQDRNLSIYTSAEKRDVEDWNYLNSFQLEEGILNTEILKINNFYKFEDLKIQVIDSTAIFKFPNFKPDLILLSNSPKVNLDRVLSILQPKLIIADASNYSSLIDMWEQTCNQKKIPFHNTRKKGALLLSNMEITKNKVSKK